MDKLPESKNTKEIRKKETLNFLKPSISYSDAVKGKGLTSDATQKAVDNQPIEKIYCPGHGMFRDFTAASILSFKQLAIDLHTTLQSGKPVEEIYRLLQPLQCETKAIQMLNKAYHDTYKWTLRMGLASHFWSSRTKFQWKYIQQLINDVEPGTDQAIRRIPSSTNEYRKVLHLINDALRSNKPETIYAVLTPFQRSTKLLSDLDNYYQKVYKINLLSDIEKNLQGDSLRYAQYLMGDKTMEISDIDEETAKRLLNAVSQLTFEKRDSIRVSVPFEDPVLSCQYRANIVCQALKPMGYRLEKVFVVSFRTDENNQKQANLYLRTDLAPDMSSGEEPAVTWWYHTAACIRVRTSSGSEIRIIDPSISSQLLDINEWVAQMREGEDKFTFLSLEDLKAEIEKEHQKDSDDHYNYPADQTYVFTTSRNCCQPPNHSTIEDLFEQETSPDHGALINHELYGIECLTQGAEWVPYNDLACYIRKNIKKQKINNSISSKSFLNDIQAFSSAVRSDFSCYFPNLYDELQAHLNSFALSEVTFGEFKKLLPDDRPHYDELAEFINLTMEKIENDSDIQKFLESIQGFPAHIRNNFRRVYTDTHDNLQARLDRLTLSETTLEKFETLLPDDRPSHERFADYIEEKMDAIENDTSAKEFLSIISRKFPPDVRSNFSCMYTILYDRLQTRLGRSPLSQTTLAVFKMLLPDNSPFSGEE